MIDQRGRACLADFGLITIVSDPAYPSTASSSTNSGTPKWMSPELLDPDHFNFKNGRPTKESDCYALGMVVYEVLRGRAPFALCTNFVVMRKVIEGERPGRPEGLERVWFTDDLWRMLQLCWSPQPKNRPTLEAVLECLKRASTTWRPLPPSADGDVEADAADESSSTVSGPGMFPHAITQFSYK